MLLLFYLRAELDKLTFPIFRRSQLGDFRTTKPQFQSKNMLVNLDIMPFLKLIRFIINRESTAFRLILDCPRMLIGSLELLIEICVFSKLNRVVMGDRKGFLENINTILNISLAFIIQIARSNHNLDSFELLEPSVNADLSRIFRRRCFIC
mgnify:CR=1 FL=1